MRQGQEEVDPKYGLPKKQKFVGFAERFNAQQSQKSQRNTNAGTPTTRLAALAKPKTAPTAERKYFDSADWAQGGEVHPLHPKLFNVEGSAERKPPLRERVKRKPAKTVEHKHLEEGKQYFDSADWAMAGSKYPLKRKAHPDLLDDSRSSSGNYGGLRKHICTSIIKKKGRIYFDSADWAISGEAVQVHHPKLGFDPVST